MTVIMFTLIVSKIFHPKMSFIIDIDKILISSDTGFSKSKFFLRYLTAYILEIKSDEYIICIHFELLKI